MLNISASVLSDYSEVRIDVSQLQVGDILNVSGTYSMVESQPDEWDGTGFDVRFQEMVHFEVDETIHLVRSGAFRHLFFPPSVQSGLPVLRKTISSLK